VNVTKLAAVSVDLDEIDCYAAIHGLSLDASRDAVYTRALPRLVALFDELGIRATFFAIGRDLEGEANQQRLRALHGQGHEIANHSLSHFYDLTRRSRAVQAAEVTGGADVIEAAVGARPVGFRAPGYTVNDGLLEVIAASGASYDSSVFPCPAYYLAKASVIGWMRARGRTSRSVVDHPKVLLAPADPYRIGKHYQRRGTGLLELPIGVTPTCTGRLPVIGTSVVSAGERGARMLASLLGLRDFVNLELHGIDLADAEQDNLEALVPYQHDLRLTAERKRAALKCALLQLKTQGFRFVTLREAASLVG
jgi:peptidoglycan/xylan/chitin deacetylase (PgdA/CDA1 family)